ncbi:hypothetical protein KH5_18720 [Urechidicola sp. KH5]
MKSILQYILFALLIVLAACSKPVSINELQFSEKEVYKDGELFSGSAVCATKEMETSFFSSLISLSFLGDSIMVHFKEGHPNHIKVFLDGKQHGEIEIWEQDGDTYAEHKTYVWYNGIVETDKINYSVQVKNGLKHGEEITRSYKPKIGSLDIKSKMNYKDGMLHGPTEIFYDSNDDLDRSQQLKEKSNYQNNRLEGTQEVYRNDGSLLRVNNYSNNNLHGESIEYYRDGESVKKVEMYEGGVMQEGSMYSVNNVALKFFKNGEEIIYNKNGLIVSEDNKGVQTHTHYIDDVKNGQETIYYASGEIWEQSNYNDGVLHGNQKKWYANGELALEALYYENELHGDFKEFYDTGKRWKHFKYKNGNKVGDQLKWHQNDVIAYQGNYVENEKHGEHLSYHSNGTLMQKDFYTFGKPAGTSELFYEDGAKWKSYTHNFDDNGNLKIDFESWYTNGNLAERYSKINDRKDGLYEKWYENGNKRLEVEFVNGEKHGRYLNWEEDGSIFRDEQYVKNGLQN